MPSARSWLPYRTLASADPDWPALQIIPPAVLQLEVEPHWSQLGFLIRAYDNGNVLKTGTVDVQAVEVARRQDDADVQRVSRGATEQVTTGDLYLMDVVGMSRVVLRVDGFTVADATRLEIEWRVIR